MVTERAKDALLRTKMEANIAEREVGLRISADPSGRWTLFPDRPQPDCLPNAQGVEELVVSEPRRDACWRRRPTRWAR